MTTKTSSRGIRPLLGFSLALLFGACDPDNNVGAPPGGGNNNGDEDSGSPDGGDDDGGSLDGGGTDGDSGEDASGDAAVEKTCTLEPGELDLMIHDQATGASTSARPWDAIMVKDTVHLLFQVKTCAETPGSKSSGLQTLSLKSTGEIGTPQDFVNMDKCVVTRAPALVDPGDGNLIAYYSTMTVGGDIRNELFRRPLASSTAERLTNDLVADGEELTQAIPYGSTELISYVNAKAEKGTVDFGPSQLVTRRPGFPENEIVAEDEAFHFADLAFVGFDSGASGGALAWLADLATDPAKPAIMLQKLTAAGTPSDDRIALSSVPGAASNVSMATITGNDKFYGAVVYGESPDEQRTELRFRTLNKTGDLVGAVRKLTSGNQNAQGASIAEFAGGYVIAYRLNTNEGAVIRLAFADPSGEVPAQGERTFVAADSAGPETKVFVGTDGRIIVVFSNQKLDGQQLRVVRGICDP